MVTAVRRWVTVLLWGVAVLLWGVLSLVRVIGTLLGHVSIARRRNSIRDRNLTVIVRVAVTLPRVRRLHETATVAAAIAAATVAAVARRALMWALTALEVGIVHVCAPVLHLRATAGTAVAAAATVIVASTPVAAPAAASVIVVVIVSVASSTATTAAARGARRRRGLVTATFVPF